MRFGILGPLEVVDDGGRRVELGGPKQRAVLAILLLHCNEVVSPDRLIEDVWAGGRPPASAVASLQAHISRLRRALGDDRRIVMMAGGYLLHVSAAEFDRERFESLVDEGTVAISTADWRAASSKLREALGLWHGPPLSEFQYDTFAQGEIARLGELQIGAVEHWIDAELALGREARAIGELEQLVREHPYRERLRSQLMLALYRTGRQAEALEAYQNARDVLVEDLGIEPSAQLRQLQEAILAQDSSLDLPAPGAPSDSGAEQTGVFVGRTRELDELVSALDGAIAGRGGLCLLAGEPGIGKSRLADALAVRARGRDAEVLVGRCWEAGGAPAYWPWLQLMRAHLRATDTEQLQNQLGIGAGELAALLPELRTILPDLPEPDSIEAEGARFRLFNAIASFLTAAARRQPLVLILDDLHAADEPSLLLLRFLVRDLAGARLLVVGAYRDVDPTVREPLSATLAELIREPVTRRIELTGLDRSEVAQYVSDTSNHVPEGRIVAEIYAETDGNPFFVGEVTRLLLREGAFGQGASVTIRLPQSVRDVIADRLRRLSDDCQEVLTLASVLGREFSTVALARLSALSEYALLDTLDEAIAERVVGAVSDRPGHLRFAHALIRDTLYQDLGLARRSQLHRKAGEVLEILYSAGLESHLTELAHHFTEAAAVREIAKALSYARRAGEQAADLLAFEEAVRLYQLALDLAERDDAVGPSGRCELLLMLGDVQARAGDTTRARETFLRASVLADQLDSGELLAHAALGYGGRFVWTRASEHPQVVPLLQHAAKSLGRNESALRVRVLARLAGALRQQAPEESDSLSAEALAVARRLGDPASLAFAISGRLWATFAPVDLDERMALASELVQAGDNERAFEGRGCRLFVRFARGDVPGLHREHAAMTRLADELGQPSQRWWVAVTGATLALLEGRFADAERLIDQGRTLGEHVESYDAPMFFELQRFALRREQGRLEEVVTGLEQAADADPSRPLLGCALAVAHWELGSPEPARRWLADLEHNRFQRVPVNNDWLLSAALLAELAAGNDNPEAADALYRRLTPYAGLNVDTGEVSTGAVSRYLALLAAATDRLDQARHHFENALTMNARMGARPWLGHTQEDYSRALLLWAKPAERVRAEELMAAATACYRELGMTRNARRLKTR